MQIIVPAHLDIPTTPPHSHSELEDICDSTSSSDSGDWTDLSAHADDVSDAASLDGEDRPTRPVSVVGGLDDGSEEAWTTADAATSPAASLYASAHTPLNPFEHETSADQRSPPKREPYPTNVCGLYGPLDPFRAPSDTDSSPSEQDRKAASVYELQLMMPDPLERSDSTVAADLSFSDDVVHATNPSVIVYLAGASPSVAQRATVVTDILIAIAKATSASCVRPDYHNFTTLSKLPRRVKYAQQHDSEIFVLVCDCTNDSSTRAHDDTPSVLVVFTSDIHNAFVPAIPPQSIFVPIVLNEAGPVVLFDEDRDDRAPDETAVDVDSVARQLFNLFSSGHLSDAGTQTAVDTLDGRSVVATEDLDEALLNTDYETSDEKTDEKYIERVAPKRAASYRVTQDVAGSELADMLKRAGQSISPRWTAACAFAVMISLLLGTGHLIQNARQPSYVPAQTTTTLLDPMTRAQTALAVKSPHTSLALKSTQSSLAVKSPNTALAVKSTQTSLARVSQVPINESCSSAHSISVSSSTSQSASSTPTSSLSTATSLSLSTQSPSFTAASASSTETARARTLASVAEDLTGAMDRIERILGWNLRQAVVKADAAGRAQSKIIIDTVNRASSAYEASFGFNPKDAASQAGKTVHNRHHTARKNAHRIRRNVDILGEKVGLGKSSEEPKSANSKNQGSNKGKAKENAKPRTGRDKWQTNKDRANASDKSKSTREESQKSKTRKGKAPFPNRAEQEGARTAKGNKRPMEETVEEVWSWDVEVVREYFHPAAFPFAF